MGWGEKIRKAGNLHRERRSEKYLYYIENFAGLFQISLTFKILKELSIGNMNSFMFGATEHKGKVDMALRKYPFISHSDTILGFA